jgi:hypothetical protein
VSLGSTSTALKRPRTDLLSSVGSLQFYLGMLRNISESGILLESYPRISEGARVEMIFEMPQEIADRPTAEFSAKARLCGVRLQNQALRSSALPFLATGSY